MAVLGRGSGSTLVALTTITWWLGGRDAQNAGRLRQGSGGGRVVPANQIWPTCAYHLVTPTSASAEHA